MLRLVIAVAAALAAAGALACGGGGAPGSRPATPALHAPRDVIAFGAQAGDGGHALYLVQPDGVDLRKLSDESGPVSFPRWSPAGDRIAYVIGNAGGPASLRVYDFALSAARALSEQALLGDASTMSWSPDGNRLAFVEDAGSGRLRIYDFAQDRLLDDAGLPAVSVDWSSSGDSLALIRPDRTEISTIRPDGSDERLLVSGEALHYDARWAPDGTLAASSAPSAQLSARTLTIYSVDGDEPRDLGPGLDPARSSDGRLAYSRPSSATAGAEFHIFAGASDGEEPQQVTRSATRDRWPSWAPAGDAIVYLAQADLETSFLCTVELATQEQGCPELAGLRPSQAAWSPF
jgi:Tol biopolymer transport system component